ncbi:hypothetical protein [Microbacterium hydrocarbonoxydans]|uniref:Uncharacterized protein n=1 Tax=Microbacterium hydrocarbonoxydans TaxID=273678 RepID=A0A1H4MDS3_9MICO|nr:hypothetical protein [Microbacterium hydrocarbonoxydans]SEB81186.1 hypothetical protein SAMN04489807_2112 [Microbacterium hydrocarbonoxydans]
METPVVLGLIFAAMSCITPFLANIRRPKKRSVDFVIQGTQTLFHVPRGVNVTVTVDSHSVEQASVTILRVANLGTEDILRTEWDGPLVIDLGASMVISARQIAARPSTLRIPAPVLRSSSIEISPFLLNSEDLFDLQIVSAGPEPTPRVSARIAGVREVRRRRPVYNLGNGIDGALDRGNKIVYMAFTGLFLALIALVAFAPMESKSGSPVLFEQRLPTVFVFVGLLGLYFAFLRWATVRNQRWRPSSRF